MKSKPNWRKQCPPELFDSYAVLMKVLCMFPKSANCYSDVSNVLDAVVALIKERVKK